MGHPHDLCHDSKKVPQGKKKTRNKPKGWKFPQQFPEKEEDNEEIDSTTNEEAQNTQENVENGSINHEVLGTPTDTSRHKMIPIEMEKRDSKCHHVSEILDSDKEIPGMNEVTHLALVMTTPSQG